MADAHQPGEGYREGSRWINQRPTGEELASWFKDNVTIHEGLEHEKYVSGIVVIEQKEKRREVVPKADGSGAVISERELLTYTPYPTASARLVYWRDYLALREAEGWRGDIEADPSVERSSLPAGFFRYSVALPSEDGRDKPPTAFVGCSMRAVIRGPDIRGGVAGRDIMIAPAGSKVVPVVNRFGKADENALMKAQTGAVGRALALAGMLVLPGTGIATAEDMRETLVAEEPPPAAASPSAALPGADAESEVGAGDPAAEALELISTLQAEYPAEHEKWTVWAKETNTNVAELSGTKLRGVVRRLRKHVDAGKAGAEAAAATAAETPEG